MTSSLLRFKRGLLCAECAGGAKGVVKGVAEGVAVGVAEGGASDETLKAK